MALRVAGFVDGFNLYHSIDSTSLDYLKWLNLWVLCEHFAPAPQNKLTAVYYFSAHATWRKDAYARHRAYVAALRAAGVTPVMGRFKEKPRQCMNCRRQWLDHEESVITSLNRPYSSELVAAAGQSARKLKRIHLERSLFPEEVADATGTIVARRPAKYTPPS